MNTLPLAPLPSETSEESHEFRRIGCEGFIDEQAVSRVIARGAYDRTSAQPTGMILSASGDDYAGWMLPVKSPFREMTDQQPAPMTAQRLPQPPTLRREAEPGIDTPYQGGHRWWVFGMSGAMTCVIMALTILSLAQRHDMAGLTIAPIPAVNGQEVPAAAVKKPAFQPTLTTVLPGER